jgi:hypothetical protein
MMASPVRASKEVFLPHHWWLIEGDNPGPKQRAASVLKAVDDLPNVECLFVGREEPASSGRWYALVWVDPKADPEELRRAKASVKVRRSVKQLTRFDQ